MIVGSSFPGDENKSLKNIQHDVYWKLVPHLLHYAQKRYLRSEQFVGVETELGRLLEPREYFDHRALQAAHDHIAAYFRFAHDDGGQMELGSDPQSHDETLERRWRQFFTAQCEELANDDAIAKAILHAVAFENTDDGYAAETHLVRLLRDRFGLSSSEDEVPIDNECG